VDRARDDKGRWRLPGDRDVASASDEDRKRDPSPLALLLCAKSSSRKNRAIGARSGDQATVGDPAPIRIQMRRIGGRCCAASKDEKAALRGPFR
jgi:hypothetical protein